MGRPAPLVTVSERPGDTVATDEARARTAGREFPICPTTRSRSCRSRSATPSPATKPARRHWAERRVQPNTPAAVVEDLRRMHLRQFGHELP